MIDLERRFGPWPVRVWGLVLNFFGNALAIYGAIGVIRDGSRLPLLLIGGCITLVCILVLPKPSGSSANARDKKQNYNQKNKKHFPKIN